jgi:hypothetical protein
VVAVWSEIRAVRRVIKLQLKCLSSAWLLAVHFYGRAQHWMSAFHALCCECQPSAAILVFFNILLTLWSCVALIPPSALLSCPGKQLLSAFWQVDVLCLNFFGLFWWHMCIHFFHCSLVSAVTNDTQSSLLVTCNMLSSILVAVLCILPWAFFRIHLAQILL